jgi:hypothetical protein
MAYSLSKCILAIFKYLFLPAVYKDLLFRYVAFLVFMCFCFVMLAGDRFQRVRRNVSTGSCWSSHVLWRWNTQSTEEKAANHSVPPRTKQTAQYGCVHRMKNLQVLQIDLWVGIMSFVSLPSSIYLLSACRLSIPNVQLAWSLLFNKWNCFCVQRSQGERLRWAMRK